MNIEKYLILNKYLLSLFGVNESKELFSKLKDVKEGFDDDGKSYFMNTIRGFENLKISEDNLLRYDQNIRAHVKKISYKRGNINLKYFQYLAVLFTEIVLDNLKNRRIEFLFELNKFLENYKQEQEITLIDSFTEDDLKKLAFWMATGSGKTLIMHINYYQFFNYKLFSPDNIILITPNEGLSKQHFEELQKSGIPSRLYAGCLNGGFRNDNEVLVIEMTKFVEEKKGGGVTLPVDVFEGRNLVFVDEGHKGRRSEEQKWAKLRNKLAENGFVFEYSATFGQILSENQPETLKEYAKSIIFDYSYRYFYLDGYGKDFSVLNVKQANISEQEFQEGMFIANLLSFYEQLLTYEENKREALEHNLEKPLWIFVGTTVTGKQEESDVIQIVEFIKRVIQDENLVKEGAEKIINGKTNLKDENGKDIFENRFNYLKKNGVDFNDLYKKVFGGKGNIGLYELKNAEGEIGLKIGGNEYFGVINIGNASGFKKQLEKKGISIGQDVISGSLFDDIKKEGSKINILIGSKKFIEGWDTWRVSSMGLLNIGKGQGPQIIQLFGRGIRLKGKGMSLKRSGENSYIKILETLNVYGIKADYLNKFLDAIRREEVEFETIKIPVILKHQHKWKTLYTLYKSEKKFEEEKTLRLKIDKYIYYTVDLLPKVSIYQAEEKREKIKTVEIKPEVENIRFSENIVDLLDWQRVWLELIDFKIQKQFWNLVFDREILKKILLSDRYILLSFPEIFDVKDEEDIKRLEDIALLVIKKYFDLFYRKNAKQFETENLCYGEVKQLPLPLISEKEQGYIVQIDKRNKQVVEEIRNLTKDLQKLLNEDTGTLSRIYFDGSLYVPILLQSNKMDKILPAGLVESEQKFVMGLKEYLKIHKNKLGFDEIYLLRNYPFSGVGFQLQWSGFYPDFIMWIKKGGKQTIVFIDPKGLEHKKGLDDEKIVFAGFKPYSSGVVTIKDIEQRLNKKNVFLESFIISKTPYQELIKSIPNPPSKDDYINRHVLFLDEKDWPARFFSLSLIAMNSQKKV
ncbi:MAG: DEAD/DEAH box helicase family protein [Candidatus Omnitrophica bacterium]|nr:DEAD/DEAH box helicase family protein [Candidatus Omnitrophota bacterium]